MNKQAILRALKYGAISGLLIVGSWFITIRNDMDFSGGEVVGYAVMLLALTAVFMGIKNKRDNSGESTFSFKDGFLTGLGIVFVASIIYVGGWMIYMPAFAPDFIDKYSDHQIEVIQKSEIPENEKEVQIDEVKTQMDNYRKPHVMAAFTFIEIFPVGLLVALISALILRRNE